MGFWLPCEFRLPTRVGRNKKLQVTMHHQQLSTIPTQQDALYASSWTMLHLAAFPRGALLFLYFWIFQSHEQEFQSCHWEVPPTAYWNVLDVLFLLHSVELDLTQALLLASRRP